MKESECTLCNSQAHFFSEAHARVFFRCKTCELVFLMPHQRLSSPEELKRYQFHQNDSKDQNYRKFLNQIAEPMVQRLAFGAQGLDYGSGPGPTLSKMLEERGFKTAVYDPYFAADEAALKRTYDFITCSETAEHFFYPGKEFDRFDQILRAGGWLGILTQILTPGQLFSDWHYMKDPTHVSFYSLQTMEWIGEHYDWKKHVVSENVTFFYKSDKSKS